MKVKTIKFTKSSRKELAHAVTVNLAQLDSDLDRTTMKPGNGFTLMIESAYILFRVNRRRNGRAVTAVTYNFPCFLKLPRVGKPVFAAVKKVID